MAMPSEIKGLELAKFVQSPSRTEGSAVEITGSITATNTPGPFSAPAGTDAVTREVSGVTEVYKYRTGGVAGAVLKTITITYTASNLEEMVSAVIT